MNEAQKQKKEQLQKQDMFSNMSFVQEPGGKKSFIWTFASSETFPQC